MLDKTDKIIIGWREWLALPELGIPAVKAKIDTGARTSALHTFNLDTVEEDGQLFATFDFHPLQKNKKLVLSCKAPVTDQRVVRDSGGHEEKRYFIATSIQLGGKIWQAEFSLTNRDNMSFRMLLGRTSIVRGGFAVDPKRSFTQGRELATAYTEDAR